MVWKLYSSSWHCRRSKSKFSNKWDQTLCLCCNFVNSRKLKTPYTKKIHNKIKIATGQGDDYTTRYLFDYSYFKKRNYKLIAIDLTKQQKLDTDPKAMQQINFTGNLDWAEGLAMFFITEEAKETVLDFPNGIVKVLWFYVVLI